MTVDVEKLAFQVTCATLAAVLVAQFLASLGGAEDQAFEATLSRLQGRFEGLFFIIATKGRRRRKDVLSVHLKSIFAGHLRRPVV